VLWGVQTAGGTPGWSLWTDGTWKVSRNGFPIDTLVSSEDPAGALVTLAVTWVASDGSLRLSRNGAAVVSVPGSAVYSPPDGTSVHDLGRWVTAGFPADAFAVAALSAWDGELTDAQLQAVHGDGYDTLHPAGAPTRLLHWHAGRDWDGAAPTSTSGGSSPVTYTVVGAPTREVI
jgi:hypothetical protein